MYNPEQYWSSRKDPSPEDVPDYVEQYIQQHLKGDTILSYGVGTGRMLYLYEGYQVSGFDIVDTYRDTCIDRANRLGLDFTHYLGDITRFKGHFDNVVCSKVLLHIPPSDLPDVLNKLMSLGDRLIVWDAICQDAPHVFSHDFKNMQNAMIRGNQLLFTYDNS